MVTTMEINMEVNMETMGTIAAITMGTNMAPMVTDNMEKMMEITMQTGIRTVMVIALETHNPTTTTIMGTNQITMMIQGEVQFLPIIGLSH